MENTRNQAVTKDTEMHILSGLHAGGRQVAVVDAGIDDYQTLIANLPEDVEVIVLRGGQDGVAELAQQLQGQAGIDALYIFSHGAEGQLLLGDTALSSANLAAHAGSLSAIGNVLSPNGDILVYGCNVGAGSDGRSFVQALGNATGADVAASDDLTGSAAKGGDWALEVVAGDIEARPVVTEELAALYSSVLAAFTGTIDFGGGASGSFSSSGGGGGCR